jgi:NADPH:quinone reductase-like Zn-dependent oxidoreductase
VDGVAPGDRVFVAALGTPGCTGLYADLAVVDAAAAHRRILGPGARGKLILVPDQA